MLAVVRVVCVSSFSYFLVVDRVMSNDNFELEHPFRVNVDEV